MFAKNETEVVVLKLIFVPSHIDISDPIINNDLPASDLLLGQERIRDWFYHRMSQIYLEIPRDNNVKYCKRKINSNDASMFTINNIRYDNVVLLVEETKIHWIYFSTKPTYRSVEGTTPLKLNYCSCCFDDQYPKFIENIQENLEATDYFLS